MGKPQIKSHCQILYRNGFKILISNFKFQTSNLVSSQNLKNRGPRQFWYSVLPCVAICDLSQRQIDSRAFQSNLLVVKSNRRDSIAIKIESIFGFAHHWLVSCRLNFLRHNLRIRPELFISSLCDAVPPSLPLVSLYVIPSTPSSLPNQHLYFQHVQTIAIYVFWLLSWQYQSKQFIELCVFLLFLT